MGDGDASVQPSLGDPFADTTISALASGVPGDQVMAAQAAAIANFLPHLPWYVWAGLGVLAFVVVRDLLR